MKVAKYLVVIAIMGSLVLGGAAYAVYCECKGQGDGEQVQTGGCPVSEPCQCSGLLIVRLEDQKCNGRSTLSNCIEETHANKKIHRRYYINAPAPNECKGKLIGSGCQGGCVLEDPGAWHDTRTTCHY